MQMYLHEWYNLQIRMSTGQAISQASSARLSLSSVSAPCLTNQAQAEVGSAQAQLVKRLNKAQIKLGF